MMILRKRYNVELLPAAMLTLVSLVSFAFVDDTDISINGEIHSTREDLVIIFQEALNRWAGGLTVTGGELASKNCCIIWSIMFGLELNGDTEQLQKYLQNSH